MPFLRVRLLFRIILSGDDIIYHYIVTGKGARVALLVTEGYKDILQIRRCQVPGGLAGEFLLQHYSF